MQDTYTVIGNPIAHSKSPLIHAAFAQQTSQSMCYTALLAPIDGFRTAVESFIQQGGKGMNITVPFKLEAYRFATRLTERANIAQAVNTFKFGNGEILGDNTDGAGLVSDIETNLGISIIGKRILLMGAGGAARGVLFPLLQKKPSLLAIANRTPSKAEALQKLFNPYGQVVAGDFMHFSDQKFDIIINATSASLQNTIPELPTDIFSRATLVYDMMYDREPTQFLKFARQQGTLHIADGIGMLVEQAAESFYLWRGIRPDTKNVIAILKHETKYESTSSNSISNTHDQVWKS